MQRCHCQVLNSATNLKSAKNWFEKCPIQVTNLTSFFKTRSSSGFFDSINQGANFGFESCIVLINYKETLKGYCTSNVPAEANQFYGILPVLHHFHHDKPSAHRMAPPSPREGTFIKSYL